MKIVGTVDLFYDTVEDLKDGKCELVTNTQRNPYGNWKKSTVATIIVEIEDEEETEE